MVSLVKPKVKAGFVALTDCAPLVVARELGFDERAGVQLEPVRLPSWSAMRDHIAFEKLECAHMLGGLSLAMHLGLSGVKTDMVVPLLMGRGGNSITISKTVYETALDAKGGSYIGNRANSASLIAPIVEQRKAEGLPPLRFATVHAFSSHNYELRAWLAHGGIDPDKDVELTVVPPPVMVSALMKGEIDGYCVGEPWSQLAVEAGIGCIVATKADLFPQSPEKVLAFRRAWVSGHGDEAAAVVDAVAGAMTWASVPGNHEDLAYILSRSEYLGVDQDVILHGLMCMPRLIPGQDRVPIRHYMSFDGPGFAYPQESSALWLLAQMRRWGQAPQGLEQHASKLCDPSLIEQNVRYTVESKFRKDVGPGDNAFDGINFDGENIEEYWRSFPIGGALKAS